MVERFIGLQGKSWEPLRLCEDAKWSVNPRSPKTYLLRIGKSLMWSCPLDRNALPWAGQERPESGCRHGRWGKSVESQRILLEATKANR